MSGTPKLRRSLPVVFICLLALPPVVPDGRAQAITGSLFGTVSDASGSRLPGVTVTIDSPQLIRQQEVRVTSDQGLYRFLTLPPGTYTVTFDLAGFRAQKQKASYYSPGSRWRLTRR